MAIKIVSTVEDAIKKPSLKELIKAAFQEEAYSPTGWEQWLPFAAKELELSSDYRDYLIYPSPMMYSDLPNRNGFAFPLQELLRYNVELGRQAYKGWAGMPMYREHQSEDPKKSLGIVIDTALTRIERFGRGKFFKVMALTAIDRNKNPDIAEKMEKGLLNTYSMGAMVNYCTCSYCEAEAGNCTHVPESNDTVCFKELKGKLVYKNVRYVKPYEYSVVEDPAFGIASHTHRLDYELGLVPVDLKT